MKKISKCICGKQPEFKSKKVYYGKGDFPTIARIECECGIQTRKFIIDGCHGCRHTKETVINFWNKLINELNKKEIL